MNRNFLAAMVCMAAACGLGNAALAAEPTLPIAAPVAAGPVDAVQLEAFKTAIRSKYAMKEKAFAAHDAETIVTRFYAEDVVSVGQGEGIFIGRDQLRPMYEEVVKNYTVKVDSVYTYVNGDAGWDWADFHVTPLKADEKPFTFAILFLWSRIGGEWICKGDFFLLGSFRNGKLVPPQASSSPAADTAH